MDLPEQGKGLAKFTFEVVKNVVTTSEPMLVNEEQQKERLDVCNDCEYYDKGRCKQCGCFMKYKTQFYTAKCPIQKW